MNNKDKQTSLFLLMIAGGLFFLSQSVYSQSAGNVFLDKGRLKNLSIVENQEAIEQLHLIVKILPIGSCSVYLSFPDGGNMLINTGNISDSDKLITSLNDEFKEVGAGMKILGWKPRIDWIVITSTMNANVGGLDKLIKKIDVRHVITPKGMKLSVPNDITVTQLSVNEEIDLIQAVSQVKLIALGKEKSKNLTENSLSLKLTYQKYRFIFFLNGVSDQMFEEYKEEIANSIIITNKPVKPGKAIDPAMIVPISEKITFVTDGNRLFIDNLPADIKVAINSVKKEVVGVLLSEAQGYYNKEYFKHALEKTKEILGLDPENRQVKIMNMLCQAQVYYTKEKYDMAKNEIHEIFKVDPENKEAKMLLIRIETVLKMLDSTR